MPSYKPLPCTLTVGDFTLSYTWARKAVKNYNMRVRADGTVHVSTPTRTTPQQVERFIAERIAFVRRALQRTAARRGVTPLSLSEGEQLPIFGVSHTVCHLKSGRMRAFCEDGKLYLALPDPLDAAARQRLFWRFATAEARRVLTDLTTAHAPQFLSAGEELPLISMRRMKGRWGSCFYTEGRIQYNTKLIFAPLGCLEYVVCHELAHFKHHDHSADFYAWLARVLPDHKERRRILRSLPIPEFVSEKT